MGAWPRGTSAAITGCATTTTRSELQAQRRAPERPRGYAWHHGLPHPRASRRACALSHRAVIASTFLPLSHVAWETNKQRTTFLHVASYRCARLHGWIALIHFRFSDTIFFSSETRTSGSCLQTRRRKIRARTSWFFSIRIVSAGRWNIHYPARTRPV